MYRQRFLNLEDDSRTASALRKSACVTSFKLFMSLYKDVHSMDVYTVAHAREREFAENYKAGRT